MHFTTHQLQVRDGGGEDIETIKGMRSPHTSYRWRGERVIEPIKCMRPPHTSYRWRGERVIETIKCMRSTTHQLQVERRERHRDNQCMRSPHTSYRWRGEERVIEPIKCMRSPHTSYRWRGERDIETISVCSHHTPATGGERESHRANQGYALTTKPATGGEERE